MSRNEAFFKTGIPFRCVLEDKPTYMALIGRSYFTVGHKFGTLVRDPSKPPLPQEIPVVAKGKNHW